MLLRSLILTTLLLTSCSVINAQSIITWDAKDGSGICYEGEPPGSAVKVSCKIVIPFGQIGYASLAVDKPTGGIEVIDSQAAIVGDGYYHEHIFEGITSFDAVVGQEITAWIFLFTLDPWGNPVVMDQLKIVCPVVPVNP
jgi:hypothetical protein